MRKRALWSTFGLLSLILTGTLAIRHVVARQVPDPATPPPPGVPAQMPDDLALPSSEPAPLPPAEPGLVPQDPPSLLADETTPGPLPSPEPLTIAEPSPEPSIVAEPSPRPVEEADPVHLVSTLSERIHARRGEDAVAVQALIQQLIEKAEAQRAALARTEEALQSARSLEAEISGKIEPDIVAETSSNAVPIEESPAAEPFTFDPAPRQ